MADDGKFSASVTVQIGVMKTYNRRPEFTGNYDINNIVANRNYNESLFQVRYRHIGMGKSTQKKYKLMN